MLVLLFSGGSSFITFSLLAALIIVWKRSTTGTADSRVSACSDDDRPSSVMSWFDNPLGTGARVSGGDRSTITSWMSNPLVGWRMPARNGINQTTGATANTEVETSDMGKAAFDADEDRDDDDDQAVANPFGRKTRQARLGTLSPMYPDASSSSDPRGPFSESHTG